MKRLLLPIVLLLALPTFAADCRQINLSQVPLSDSPFGRVAGIAVFVVVGDGTVTGSYTPTGTTAKLPISGKATSSSSATCSVTFAFTPASGRWQRYTGAVRFEESSFLIAGTYFQRGLSEIVPGSTWPFYGSAKIFRVHP